MAEGAAEGRERQKEAEKKGSPRPHAASGGQREKARSRVERSAGGTRAEIMRGKRRGHKAKATLWLQEQ